MAEATWPARAILTSSKPRLVGQVRMRSWSISGSTTIVPSLSSYWEAELRGLLADRSAQLEWDGFLAQMAGGLGVCTVPLYVRHRVRTPDGEGVPHSAEEPEETHEHWYFAHEPRAAITLAEDAALRATDLALTLLDSERPRPGQRLSISDRLYRVALSWVRDDDVPMVRVDPPLRAAELAEAHVEVDRPTCRMRLASEGEGEVEEEPGPVTQFRIRLVEDV